MRAPHHPIPPPFACPDRRSDDGAVHRPLPSALPRRRNAP
ncbi:hypothetical protein SGPA1_10033 [Streptomyces misionensis JCM 4497]